MAFNVTQFTAALPKGGARSGLFRCTISVPSGVSIKGEVQKTYALTAHAASIPASTIEPTDVNYFGRAFRIPGTRTFEDWTTTIYSTEDYAVRDMFERWSDTINGVVTNTSSESLGLGSDSYTKDIEVELYGKDGKITRTYLLVDAWPTTIGASDLSWEGNDIQTFEVTWAYTHWIANWLPTGLFDV